MLITGRGVDRRDGLPAAARRRTALPWGRRPAGAVAQAPTIGDVDTELRQTLHRRGLRMTPQREQVLAAVRSLGHATPEQISETVPVDVTTVNRTAETVVRLLPPLVITEADVDEGLTRLEAALGAVGAGA